MTNRQARRLGPTASFTLAALICTTAILVTLYETMQVTPNQIVFAAALVVGLLSGIAALESLERR